MALTKELHEVRHAPFGRSDSLPRPGLRRADPYWLAGIQGISGDRMSDRTIVALGTGLLLLVLVATATLGVGLAGYVAAGIAVALAAAAGLALARRRRRGGRSR